MRVVHLNTFDARGGAAITVSRLHRALRAAGVDSQLLVQFRSTEEPAVSAPTGKLAKALALLGDALDPLPLLAYRGHGEAVFSPNWVPSSSVRRALTQQADLLHLHWINAGMLPIRALRRFDGPLVWTLHDMWAFTGGCHQSGSCNAYRTACGRCPALESTRRVDLSARILSAKLRAWRDIPIVPVAPSEWLADRARESRLFGGRDVHVIPHGLDLSVYKPWDPQMARRLLKLPAGRLVMFSAAKGLDAPQKGGSVVRRIMAALGREMSDVKLVVMGGQAATPGETEGRVHFLGQLHDDAARALAFSAVDALLMPSEGESFGNVILEAVACGTPVAAYATGAARSLLRDPVCGRAVPIGDEAALALALHDLLAGQPRQRDAVRRATEGHDVTDMAAAYQALYAQVLSGASA